MTFWVGPHVRKPFVSIGLVWLLIVAAALGHRFRFYGLFLRYPIDQRQGLLQGGFFLLFVVLPLLSTLATGMRRQHRWVSASVLAYCCCISVGEANLLCPIALLIWASSMRDEDRASVAIGTEWTIYAVLGISLLLSPFLRWFETPGYGGRFCGPFSSPITFYPIGVLGFALAQSRRNEGLFSYLLEVTSLVAVVLSGSRSGLLAVSACSIASMVVKRKLSARGAATIAICVATIILRTSNVAGDEALDQSALSRPTLWSFAFRQVRQEPFFGLGPHGFAYSPLRREMLEIHPMMPAEPKNMALFFLVSYGVIGVVWFLWAASALGRQTSPAIGMIIVALVVSGLFDSSFALISISLPGAALLGLLVGALGTRSNANSGETLVSAIN